MATVLLFASDNKSHNCLQGISPTSSTCIVHKHSFATSNKQTTNMSTLKIAVMGSGGVGKSALTVRYTSYVFLERYDPTIEDIYRKMIEVDGKQYMLEIIDTAGTEQFTAMRDMYIKNADGFVLVYSITSASSLTDLEDLHTQILQIKDTENVPMILVGNKADLNDSRMITTETGKDTANRWNASFMEVSAKNCMGVEDCFNNVSKQIVSTLPKPKSKKTKCTIV